MIDRDSDLGFAILQDIPSPLIAGICLLVSLGLHGITLVLPVAFSPTTLELEESEEEPAPDDMAVIVLSPPEPEASATGSSTPSPSPERPEPQPTVEAPLPEPLPSFQPDEQDPPDSDPEEPIPPEDGPEDGPEERPEDEPDGGQSESPPQPYADFPHMTGATAGCGPQTDHCWGVPGTGYSVRRDLISRLESQGHTVNPVDRYTGIRIYSVAKDGETYYLHIVELASTSGSRYLIADEQMPFAQLEALRNNP